jgi:hypothetical protein
VTPTGVINSFWRWFWIGVLGLALVAVLVVAGWRAGWWFRDQDANRQAELTQNGVSNQSSLRQQMEAQISNGYQLTSQIAATPDAGERQALKAQRAAITGIACSDAAQIITPLGPSEQQWVSTNCQAGAIRPGSPYYQAGTP